jgi:rod shape-determining protein MreD
MTALRVTLAVLALWASAVWQLSLVGQNLFLGIRQEPVLLVVFLVAVRVRPGLAAGFGFVAGLIQGAAVGADLTALALSRTLMAFVVSFVARSGLQIVPIVMGLIAALATAGAQVALMFMAPPPDIGRFLGATLGTAIYNGVVACLLDALLRRTLDPQVD